MIKKYSKDKNLKSLKDKENSITSLVLPGGTVYELLYSEAKQQTSLAKWKKGIVEVQPFFRNNASKKIIPYSPYNQLLQRKIILFPDEIKEYGSDESLIKEIHSFIHCYVDTSPVFEWISVYYVLLSWIYDTFNEIPYLRIRGDYGSGKTRFLQTVGSITYKPIFASGGSTVAPIFHMLDKIGGTLILDEADFRFSSETADIIKILNNGNAKGFSVLRCERINQREFSPKAYTVFGPKIISSRHDYEDQALESRFITEDTSWRKIRDDIPITLPESFQEEALDLRNKLLLWRFRNFDKKRNQEAYIDPKLDKRLNQVFMPLLSLVDDEPLREKILKLAREKNTQLKADRGLQVEADVLLSIKKCYTETKESVSISQLTEVFNRNFGHQYDERITPKWIGSIVRKKLRLSTRKKNGRYILSENQKGKIKGWYQRFNL